MKNVLGLAFVSLAVLASSGCGDSLAQVTGTVEFDGKPLKQGQIGFIPEKGRPSYGTIVDGKIVEVTTKTKGDGLPPGDYKVQITAVENPDDIYKSKSLLPARYGNPGTSGFQASIKAGTNTVEFKMKK